MVASETGTGKTAAFCLPIIQCVHERLREKETKIIPEKSNEALNIIMSESDRDVILTVTDGLTCQSSDEKVWAVLFLTSLLYILYPLGITLPLPTISNTSNTLIADCPFSSINILTTYYCFSTRVV